MKIEEQTLDSLGIRRGLERNVIRSIVQVRSISRDRAERAAARDAGLRATREVREKFGRVIKSLVVLGILEETGVKERLRLNKRLFFRKDDYLRRYIAEVKRVMEEASQPISKSTLIRRANRAMGESGKVRGLPSTIVQTMARQPKRSGFKIVGESCIGLNTKLATKAPVRPTDRTRRKIPTRENEHASSQLSANPVTNTSFLKKFVGSGEAVPGDSHPDHLHDDEESVEPEENDVAYLSSLIGIEPVGPTEASAPDIADWEGLGEDEGSSSVDFDLNELSTRLECLWIQTEVSGGVLRANVMCNDGRSQAVFVKALSFGPRGLLVLEITSPISSMENAKAVDFNHLASKLTFSWPTTQEYKGAEFIMLVTRLPAGTIDSDSVMRVIAEIAQAADELELSWCGVDLE